MELRRADGKALTFIANGSGGWDSAPDVTGTLERFEDGQGNSIGWRYTTLDQQLEHYDTSGRLMSVTDKFGLSHNYNYSPSTVTVTHSGSGEQLVYSLDSTGRIDSFTTPDGDNCRLSYDVNDNLTGITYPDGGGTRIYHYENGSFPNLLTGITDANGNRFASWSYDSAHRAISSTHHNGPDDIDRHTVDYTYLNDTTDPRSTVTNPLGKKTTYHFTTIHGVRKVTQVKGHPSSNCAAANKNYSYDNNGFLASKTDWKGNTTTYVRSNKGQELSRTEAVGTPQERTITTEWHATFNLPVKITEPGRETAFTYDANGHQMSQTVTEMAP